jgi:hypothetical protein
MHPVVAAAQGLPADQGAAAVREAAQVDGLVAATEALDPDDTVATRQLIGAAAAVGLLYNTYITRDGSGRLARWYYESLRLLQARAVARLGARRGRTTIVIPWEPLR